MPSLTDLLGSELLSKDGKISTESHCSKCKVVALYFSAHWCPPCRGFTPKLAEFYNKIQAGENKDKFEVVFVSSDRNQPQFDEYFGEMPWKAVPYDDRERKATLSKKFKVSGIPTLVFVDGETGKLITDDGRTIVMEDPEAKNYPWPQKTLSEIFQGELLKNVDGEKTTVEESCKGKVLGLYFSAHWCPPCRGFTPSLVDTYKKVREKGKNFEIVFLSSDRSEDSYKEYFQEMPWLAMPYDDPRKKELSSHFKVEGIPALVILDEEMNVITDNGRAAINGDKEGEKFPWVPESLQTLSDETVSAVNDSACLIYLTKGSQELVTSAKSAMTKMAEDLTKEVRERKKHGDSVDDEVRFFYEDDEEETADSLRSFLGLEDRAPLVMLLDIPNEKKYVLPQSEEITEQKLRSIVSDYKASKLEMQALR